jgi:predicted nuclease of predicted toxin-antitoxin system
MLILADENCDTLLVARLRDAGRNVAHILEQAPGTPDEAILEAAVAQSRILLTNDLEFGLLAERLGKYPPAIVLLRLDPLRAQLRADIVTHFFDSVEDGWRGKFFVIEPGSVRERFMDREAH